MLEPPSLRWLGLTVDSGPSWPVLGSISWFAPARPSRLHILAEWDSVAALTGRQAYVTHCA